MSSRMVAVTKETIVSFWCCKSLTNSLIPPFSRIIFCIFPKAAKLFRQKNPSYNMSWKKETSNEDIRFPAVRAARAEAAAAMTESCDCIKRWMIGGTPPNLRTKVWFLSSKKTNHILFMKSYFENENNP